MFLHPCVILFNVSFCSLCDILFSVWGRGSLSGRLSGQRLSPERDPPDRDHPVTETLPPTETLPSQRPSPNQDHLDRDSPGQRPPGQRHPWTETPLDRPPGQRHPWTETPLDSDPVGQRLPRTETPGTETPCPVTSGWYTSYWNALLFILVFRPMQIQFFQKCKTNFFPNCII